MMNGSLNIGDAAAASGVPAKTIRFYEDIGLIAPARRGANGYRRFERRAIEELRFTQRARRLGFPVEEVRALLELWRDPARPSADVKALAERRMAAIDRKMAELRTVRGAVTDLIDRCHGDERPECPIIDELAAP